MKQKKLILNFFVDRNWKKLTDSRGAKILADNRKSDHPIKTLLRGSLPKNVPLDFRLDKFFALYFYHQHYYPS